MSFHLYSAFSLFPFPLSFSTAQEQRVYFVLSRGNFAHPCDEASERKGSSDKDHWGETKMRIKGAFLCLYVHPWRKSFSEAGFSCSQFRHAFSLHFLLLSSLSRCFFPSLHSAGKLVQRTVSFSPLRLFTFCLFQFCSAGISVVAFWLEPSRSRNAAGLISKFRTFYFSVLWNGLMGQSDECLGDEFCE